MKKLSLLMLALAKPCKRTTVVLLFLLFAAAPVFTQQLTLRTELEGNINRGFTHIRAFTMNRVPYIFCHNTRTGDTSIWNLEAGGDAVYSDKWSSGWTNFDFYTIDGNTYFFHQKTGDGLARINRLAPTSFAQKNMGTKVFEDKWSAGWTSTKYFVHKELTYFFHYKKSDGTNRLNAGSNPQNVGSRIHGGTYTSGYDDFSFAIHNGFFYTLSRTNESGRLRLNRHPMAAIEAAANNGTNLDRFIGDSMNSERGSAGHGAIALFTLRNRLFMFNYAAATGKLQIHEINADGQMGRLMLEQTWARDWTNFDIVYMNNRVYLYGYKSGDGRMILTELRL